MAGFQLMEISWKPVPNSFFPTFFFVWKTFWTIFELYKLLVRKQRLARTLYQSRHRERAALVSSSWQLNIWACEYHVSWKQAYQSSVGNLKEEKGCIYLQNLSVSWFYLHSCSHSFHLLVLSHPRICRHPDLHSQVVCPAPLVCSAQDKGSWCLTLCYVPGVPLDWTQHSRFGTGLS